MKSGTRALGIAESSRDTTGTLAGAVVRANRVFDGLAFASCTVGGTDATDAVLQLDESLDRADINYLFLAGIAPAWFNLFDLHRLHDQTGLPTLSISFEASEGLDSAIRDAFDGEACERRLSLYQAQPPRQAVELSGETRYVRAVGLESQTPEEVVQAFTPAGGRPEPLRVARIAARAGDRYQPE